MSGGADSLRTAFLLKEEGLDVFGIHMRHIPQAADFRGQEGTEDEREAALRSLTSRLGIPLFVVDMRKPFEESVIQPFLDAYLEGLTPNPCAICNPKIKFGVLLREALLLGAELLATGHYARIIPPNSESGRFRLLRARDKGKDQSYFLFGLAQEQLAHALFPLGDSLKREVLQWAEEVGFASFLPEESQEICFVPSGNYQDLLRKRVGIPPASIRGPIVDVSGKILGEHKGIFAYTIGQRRGLGIASKAPYYVVGLDRGTNTVVVSRANDLHRSEFRAQDVNWVSIPMPQTPIDCQVRIRNQHKPAAAKVTPLNNTETLVLFREPQRAVTPGQAAVFYDGDMLLGGGTIREPVR